MTDFFNNSTRELIVNIYAWYVFVPVLAGVIFWTRLSSTQRLILYISLLSGVNHLTANLVMKYADDSNNTWVAHAYVPILFWLMWRIYKEELRGIFSKRFFEIILGISLLFFLGNSLFIQGFRVLPTNGIFLLSGIFMFWGFSYFYSLLRQTQFRSLEKEPVFWFNAGVLMYYSSTIIIFLLVFNLLAPETEATYIATILNAFFNLVLVTTYLISIWVKPTQ